VIAPFDLEHGSNWDAISTITGFPVRLQVGAQVRQGTVLSHWLWVIQWQIILHRRQLRSKLKDISISPVYQDFQKSSVYSTVLCIFHTPGYLCKNMDYSNIS